jgi:hypothetical protein
VFTGLIRAWQAQGGIPMSDVPEQFFKEIDEKYVPLESFRFYLNRGIPKSAAF